jgi:hypothetical protein
MRYSKMSAACTIRAPWPHVAFTPGSDQTVIRPDGRKVPIATVRSAIIMAKLMLRRRPPHRDCECAEETRVRVAASRPAGGDAVGRNGYTRIKS